MLNCLFENKELLDQIEFLELVEKIARQKEDKYLIKVNDLNEFREKYDEMIKNDDL